MSILKTRDRQNARNLLLACVSKSPSSEEQLEHLCRQQKNWQYVIEQVRWHRVAALVWRKLKTVEPQIPGDVIAEMKRLNQANRLKTLKHFTEITHLTRILDEQNIPFLILKGPVLSRQLHDDPGMRFNKDIDLLVSQTDLAKAADILCSQGYTKVLVREDLPAHIMDIYLKRQKDFSFYHHKKRIHIELHWEWCTNKHIFNLPVEKAIARRQFVCAENARVPVLAADDNRCYLLMHIFASTWARLSWLSDFDSIFRDPDLDWLAMEEHVKHYQLENAFYTTVLLSHSEYHTPVPVNILDNANRCFIARALYMLVKNYNLKCKYPPYLLRVFTRVLLKKKFRYQLDNLSVLFISINDIALLPLPKPLYPLYYVLRPFLWSWRHIITRKANQIV